MMLPRCVSTKTIPLFALYPEAEKTLASNPTKMTQCLSRSVWRANDLRTSAPGRLLVLSFSIVYRAARDFASAVRFPRLDPHLNPIDLACLPPAPHTK